MQFGLEWRSAARARARALLLLAAAALALSAAPLSARSREVLEGRVVRVADGDSLELLLERSPEPLRIRIAGIDAPERGQPWNQRARKELARRVLHKLVRVIEVDRDRYGRTVGEVYADDVCVGCELVREGHVWVYRRFSQDPVLIQLEEGARRARRGLWSLPARERVPPWEWRRARARRG